MIRHRLALASVSIIPIILATACTEAAPPIEGPLRVWDTLRADRHVISAEEADRASRWLLPAEPILKIGGGAGGDGHGGDDDGMLFGAIQDLTLLASGRIAVIDVQASALLFFSSNTGGML